MAFPPGNPTPLTTLSVADHRRDSAGMTYVYPVVSRRAGGVSVGINLNPNNACNWRCIYCQVPNLRRGGPPPIDLQQLEHELINFLEWAVVGDFMATRVPEGNRKIVDIAFSGNGEPTTAKEFTDAVSIVQATMIRFSLLGKTQLRLITNGSMLDRRLVQQGIASIGRSQGEVWFKLDTISTAGLTRINGTRASPGIILRRLKKCATLAPTWIQTCLFELDGKRLPASDFDLYLKCVQEVRKDIAGIHLYGIARKPMQNESNRLGRLDRSALESLADRIRAQGVTVCVNP
jgi:wyosine [tRNA(Phe)-imidazoG37] synthetase (radical SAM superfamily)